MDPLQTSLKPNILIAPLDWGLGHATRCIPVIKSLIHHCNVILAGEGSIKNLLQSEFPELKFLDLKGYRIQYSNNKWTLPFVIASQIPKILRAINEEQKWMENAVKQHAINAIISDNRYGLWHKEITSVFITHQLQIKTMFGKYVEHYMQQLNYNYINRFDECWVPDYKNENSNLAGELSHPLKEPDIPVKYIGLLSRFSFFDKRAEKNPLILLSGPEPQRTILEAILLTQLEHYKEPVIMVRGLPRNGSQLNLPDNILVYNHLPARELEEKMAEASFVISRSGYSTVMDIAALKKKSILIPTPGQTEQEYLARNLFKNNFALCFQQSKFKLRTALELAKSFEYKLDGFNRESHLESAIKSLLYKIEFRRS